MDALIDFDTDKVDVSSGSMKQNVSKDVYSRPGIIPCCSCSSEMISTVASCCCCQSLKRADAMHRKRFGVVSLLSTFTQTCTVCGFSWFSCPSSTKGIWEEFFCCFKSSWRASGGRVKKSTLGWRFTLLCESGTSIFVTAAQCLSEPNKPPDPATLMITPFTLSHLTADNNNNAFGIMVRGHDPDRTASSHCASCVREEDAAPSWGAIVVVDGVTVVAEVVDCVSVVELEVAERFSPHPQIQGHAHGSLPSTVEPLKLIESACCWALGVLSEAAWCCCFLWRSRSVAPARCALL